MSAEELSHFATTTTMALVDIASIQVVTHHYAFLAALGVVVVVALYLVRLCQGGGDDQLLTIGRGPQPQIYRR